MIPLSMGVWLAVASKDFCLLRLDEQEEFVFRCESSSERNEWLEDLNGFSPKDPSLVSEEQKQSLSVIACLKSVTLSELHKTYSKIEQLELENSQLREEVLLLRSKQTETDRLNLKFESEWREMQSAIENLKRIVVHQSQSDKSDWEFSFEDMEQSETKRSRSLTQQPSFPKSQAYQTFSPPLQRRNPVTVRVLPRSQFAQLYEQSPDAKVTTSSDSETPKDLQNQSAVTLVLSPPEFEFGSPLQESPLSEQSGRSPEIFSPYVSRHPHLVPTTPISIPIPSTSLSDSSSDEDSDEGKPNSFSDFFRYRTVTSEGSQEVIKSGFLLKKGGKRRNWKRRWFVLQADILAYYSNPKVIVNLTCE